MLLREIIQFVEGTSDPAFAVDCLGIIAQWNHAATGMFGVSAAETIGKPCSEVIRGVDECGAVCSRNCIVKQSASKHQLMHNFDLRINTPKGRKWFNISVIIVDVETAVHPYTIHILRLVDVNKRLEMVLRDFIVSETSLSEEAVIALISSSKSVVQDAFLTEREVEILSLVAKGKSSKAISEQLFISPTTVNNHLQHILKKLNAHSRLEAVRRAERSGII